MELLDRYLQAVGKYLPKKRREDIVAELRANLLEQAEDRAAELGKPLTLDDEEALLKQFGHPMAVAARYLPQQYLIGPTVFPYYWYGLKTLIPLVFLVYMVVNAATFLNEPVTAERVLGMLLHFPAVAFYVAAWITLIAVVVELTKAKCLPELEQKWSPRKLPKVEAKSGCSRSHTIFEVVGGGFAVLWFLAIPQSPFLILGPGSAMLKYFHPLPILHTAYWAFVWVLIAQWTIEVIGLFSARWRSVRPVLGLLGRGAIVVILWFLMRAPQLFTLSEAGQNMPQYQALLPNLSRGVTAALRVLIFIMVLQILWEAGKMIFAPKGPAMTGNINKQGVL